jgi:hypothetical protein
MLCSVLANVLTVLCFHLSSSAVKDDKSATIARGDLQTNHKRME